MSVGSVARAISCDLTKRQSDGHWLCWVCKQRIKPRERSQPCDGGRAHRTCKATVTTQVVVKKRLSLATPSLSVAPSRPTTRSRTKTPFEVYGYARVKANDKSRQLAWEAVQISRRATAKHSSVIDGNVRQFDLSSVDELLDFRARWSDLIKEEAERLGISTNNKFVVDPKLLVAPPKLGHQAVHWDGPRDKKSFGIISCLLYCSNGCNSTALPLFPTDDILSFSHDPEEMASVAHLLDASQYESQPVLPGDLVFFRHSTPHFGVQNVCDEGDRVVLFGILSPSEASMQDAQQVPPWLYVGAAFGWNSKQFAQALVDYKAFAPIQRIHRDEGDSERDICLKSLRRWNLFDLYHS